MEVDKIKELDSFYNFLNKHDLSVKEVNYKYSEQAFEILCFKDTEYRIIWTNHKDYLLNKFNLTEEELYNKPCYKLFCKRDEPYPHCPLKQAYKSLEQQKSEIQFPNNNIFSTRVFPVKDSDNELSGFVQNIINITQEKKLKENLEQKNRKIYLFTNLSHELRTPLNLMHSSLQIINMHFNKLDISNNKKDKFKKYFNLIRQNNYRLMKIVNNIMDLQKMDTGNYKIDFKNNDIVECIRDITLSSSEYAKDQGKTIKFKSYIDRKIISFDPYEVERIMLNLISNAFKYTDPGDTITVKIMEKGNYIVIIIKDTGIGIPQEKQKEIFNKFSRVDDSFYRKSEGSGLGLSIVQFIVNMHNGKISLVSDEKKGSKFILKLPVKQKDSVKKDSSKTRKVNSMIDRMEIEYSDIYM